MVTNYYNSSNNFSSPVRCEPKPHTEPICDNVSATAHPEPKDENDKLLLVGLLVALYFTGCRDKILLLALVFLLIY